MAVDTTIEYSVEVFVSDPLSSTQGCPTTSSAYKYFGPYISWIPVTGASGTVNSNQGIVYVIRLWAKGETTTSLNAKGNSGPGYVPYSSGGSLLTWATSLKSLIKVQGGIQIVHGRTIFNTTGSAGLVTGDTNATTDFSGDAFYMEVTPLPGVSGTITVPNIVVELGSDTDPWNTSQNDYIIPKTQLRGSIPVINITKGSTTTKIAPQEIQDLEVGNADLGILGGESTGFSACTNLWYGTKHVVTATHLDSTGASFPDTYSVSLVSYTSNGAPGPIIPVTPSTETAAQFKSGIGPATVAAKKLLQTYINCSTPGGKPGATGPTPPKGSTAPVGSSLSINSKLPKNMAVSNPPNHVATRDVSFFRKSGVYKTEPGADINMDNSIAANSFIDLTDAGNLGFITVDFNSKKYKASQYDWVFRFNYNPTSISYQTTPNTSIDWTLASADPANVIGGNTTVSLTLYLNRIADLADLNNGRYSSANYFGVNLLQEQKDGLMSRGTEYDLEYLYRVINGDPQDASQGLLLGTAGGISSDFGYITGMPCWIKLNNSLRYKISMSSISVNHVLFTESMVPTLTTVDISFVRIPYFGPDSSDIAKAASKAQKDYNGSKSSVGGIVTGGTN